MSEKTISKKELKQIDIVEVIKHHASGYSDMEGEWHSRFKIDFVLSKSFSFNVLGKEFLIDRIRIIDDEFGFYSNTPDVEIGILYANENRIYKDFIVSKLFLHKLYNKLLEVERKGEVLDGWLFHDDIWCLLTNGKG